MCIAVIFSGCCWRGLSRLPGFLGTRTVEVCVAALGVLPSYSVLFLDCLDSIVQRRCHGLDVRRVGGAANTTPFGSTRRHKVLGERREGVGRA